MKQRYFALITTYSMLSTALNLGGLSAYSYSMDSMEKHDLLTANSAATKPPYQEDTIHIVSKEGVEVMQKINAIANSHPYIAQPIPQINSLEDYLLAKNYITLCKRQDVILKAAILSQADRAHLLFNESHQILDYMQSYVTALQSPVYDIYRTAEEQKLQVLQGFYFNILYRRGENHLLALIQIVGINKALHQDEDVLQDHVKAIKNIKEQLTQSRPYRIKFRSDLEKAQEMFPVLHLLFNPERAKHTSSIKPRKLPPRIVNTQQANLRNKQMEPLAEFISAPPPPENFDLYFQVFTQKLLTDELLFSTRRMPDTEYYDHLQQLWQQYMRLEQEGYEFWEKLGLLPARASVTELTIENLTNLYHFLRQKFASLPHKDPIILVEHIIFILIQTNQLPDALIHAEVLGNLLKGKEGLLPDKYLSLRANILALNGQPEEWIKLKESKDRANQTRKKKLHQVRLALLKNKLEQKKERDRLEAQTKAKRLQETSKQPKKSLVSASVSLFELPSYSSQEQPASPEIPVRQKVKTRKAVSNVVYANKETNKADLPIQETEKQPIKKYFISQNALKVYRKIRQGERNFSRQNLFNLFEKLGCKPELSQGKGDHSKIPAPLTMTIHSQDKVVGIIPEFTVKRYQATPFPLIVPNWDEKWDGMVPHYMMKSIITALDFIGATDDAVY